MAFGECGWTPRYDQALYSIVRNGLYSKSGLCHLEQRVLGHISPEAVSWEERDIFNDLTSLVGQRQITQLDPVYFLSGSITCLDIMYRQHCRLTICIELVELTNSETAATTPSGGGAKSLRSLSSLETGSVWRFLVN